MARRASEELRQRLRGLVLRRVMEIQEVSKIEGVVVTVAVEDKDVGELVLLALREAKQPLSWRDLKFIFAGIAGEDRLRRVLGVLKAGNRVAELPGTRFSLPEYVPVGEVFRVKNPGVIGEILKSKMVEPF